MKNKGFTLIELLAVIVILAVIALIATPMIMDVIEKSKKSSLQDSAYGLVEAADMYYTEHIQEGIQEPIVFEFENGVQISEQKLTYKGKIQEGKLILNTNGKTVVCISDGKYYAYKNIEESEVTGGTGSCKYNGETGDFEIISDVDTLNERIKTLQEELNTIKGQGDATAEEIKEGKTAVVQGELITGTATGDALPDVLTFTAVATNNISSTSSVADYSLNPNGTIPLSEKQLFQLGYKTISWRGTFTNFYYEVDASINGTIVKETRLDGTLPSGSRGLDETKTDPITYNMKVSRGGVAASGLNSTATIEITISR